MAIAKEVYYDIYEKLEYKFLYNNDLNSIHILLNLYDLDKNIKNIHPKYISSNRVRDSIRNILVYRGDRIEVSNVISRLLHEDINRLELYICIEGYKNGYFNRKLANKLENITIRNISTDKLYNKEYLHHFNSETREIEDAKYRLYNQIDDGLESKAIYKLVDEYIGLIIEGKLSNINEYLNGDIKELTREEISRIRVEILQIIESSVASIYKESYWYGLNDRVLKRYR